ncbi:hypothetical protein [Pedobacter sp. UBA5917]|jgi:GLPGLI family protein|uniref:hypothetical protein n=1 Tax=Pedobacter sp. UBA5917 TaxID=1947061 RepID=UPI0025F9510A|nr:hypothetical protein [Pedobacter sp. UBA5917]
MKTTAIILTIATAFLTLSASAQDKTQGKVTYENTINIHAGLKPDQLQYKDMLPEFSTYKEELYFNGKKTKTTSTTPEDQESDGVSIKMSTDDEGDIYSDGTQAGTYSVIRQKGKYTATKIKVKKEAEEKLGTKKKNILGFECTEVIAGEKTLWVTAILPFKGGPSDVFSKYGAVLGVEQGKKFKAYATAINYVPVKIEEVTLPAGTVIK